MIVAPLPRSAIAIALLAILAWAGASALRVGAAGETVYRTADELSAWNASQEQPKPAAVAQLAGELEQAREATPSDANAEELLGRLAMLDNARAGFLDEAMAHYGRALALRPTSPYTWAAIVEALYRKGDTGPRFWRALDRAAVLGPQEPDVGRVIADYGLALWGEASAGERKTIDSAVAAEVRRGSPDILQVAERRGRLAVACRHMGIAPRPIDPRWLNLCSWEGTT